MSKSPKPEAHMATLPPEILTEIFSRVPQWDMMRLRITNKRFYTLIAPPTFEELFEMQWSFSPCLACGYCLRYRPKEKFAPAMITNDNQPYLRGDAYDWHTWCGRKYRLRGSDRQTKAKCRFCIDCGPRPMDEEDDGTHRYRGDTWEEDGVLFTRCLRCGRCAQAWKANRSMCIKCHSQLDAQFARPVALGDEK